ncbi:DNA adenine methylase [Maribacter dokdonensis]|uniref:Site-specific DNA-methyltransferase (adenine-specific) n=1 Tax=Maribacter dokdonensis TaxID=320912 RepID=A0A1H4WUU3_9FLAO|nr:Dam family site-specific DNA-(adenine-N6)-methyltransferase [Maribacter dokdonensis]SEC96498.1 DNA adenine methylase [Maribacter dokdonensis]
MKTPQPIPYQGSKRILAPTILNFFPDDAKRLIEPFAGSAAVSIAAAIKNKVSSFLINDVNEPLIKLIKEIVENPVELSDKYERLWQSQLGNEKSFFIEQRAKFNETKEPHIFLYVLARCIKGAVRYNSEGVFNQSADNRRRGKRPENMRKDVYLLSSLLKNKVKFQSLDYSEIFKSCTPNDIVYMDPPYQGTSGTKDHRYLSGLKYEDFVKNLRYLNDNSISYLISYDGKTGDKTYGIDLPKDLNLHKIMIEAGRSTQSTLLGNKEITFESLYLSESLMQRLPNNAPVVLSKYKQLELI